MNGKKVLLVEDNPKVMKNNMSTLRSCGAEVLSALTLAEARSLAAGNSFDVAVLDIMLPDGSGLDLLKELRAVSNVPILLLTAKSDSKDVVTGLTLGADDYLTKPYFLDVFEARIDALLRRAGTVSENVTIGSLRFNLISNQAYYDGRDLLLTYREFSLLLLLAQNEKKTLTAEYLFEKVWGQPLSDNTVALRNQLLKLRRKLSAVTENIIIETSRGEGYSLTMQKNLS